MAPLLAAGALTLSRGGRELFRDLSFEINAGDLVQIEGPNGAGKTSLMRILAGLSRYGFDGTVERGGALLYLGHKSAVKGQLSPRENLALHVGGEGTHSSAAIDESLDTPRYRFLVDRDGRLTSIAPPAVGETIVVPEVAGPVF